MELAKAHYDRIFRRHNPMHESIKSACKVLDRFGLPRAIGSLVTDRFIVANNSFLRVIGLGRDEISSVALSEIVTIFERLK